MMMIKYYSWSVILSFHLHLRTRPIINLKACIKLTAANYLPGLNPVRIVSSQQVRLLLASVKTWKSRHFDSNRESKLLTKHALHVTGKTVSNTLRLLPTVNDPSK